MRDLSINLPAWAYRIGYRIEGGLGTYGDLFLRKDGAEVDWWNWSERQPNIFEMEELIAERESKEATQGCPATYQSYDRKRLL